MLSLLQPITSPRKHVWASNYVSNSFKRTSRLRRAASPVPVANSSPIITELPQQFSELKSNGLLLIDKPRGWDMLDVIEAVKQAGGVKPLAHGGRLDISATGLVLVTSGAANKRAPSFMQLPKTFEGSFKLGASTDTYDAEGSVWEQVPWRHVTGAPHACWIAG